MGIITDNLRDFVGYEREEIKEEHRNHIILVVVIVVFNIKEI